MFAHVNVRGAMSGALTTGDTLTGGTSGATGTIESISTAASATITGVTAAQPACCNLFWWTLIYRRTTNNNCKCCWYDNINTNHTVKNPTATTFELFTASTATIHTKCC